MGVVGGGVCGVGGVQGEFMVEGFHPASRYGFGGGVPKRTCARQPRTPNPQPNARVRAQGIRAASSSLGGLDGITTFCEMAVPLVARLAEKLGLPGNSPDSVDAARDKVRVRCLVSGGCVWCCRAVVGVWYFAVSLHPAAILPAKWRFGTGLGWRDKVPSSPLVRCPAPLPTAKRQPNNTPNPPPPST